MGQGYVDFGQTSDSEVCDLLQRSRAAGPAAAPRPADSRLALMIGIERVGDVTTIEQQRAERRNALNAELVDQLREAIERRPPTTCA